MAVMTLSSISDQCSAVLKCTRNAISVAVTFYTFASKKAYVVINWSLFKFVHLLEIYDLYQLHGQWHFLVYRKVLERIYRDTCVRNVCGSAIHT
jgi:hypothetical protein